jgi:hypothetical protein
MTTKWRNVSSPCFTTSHLTSGENSEININSPVELLWKGKPDVVAPNYQEGLTSVPSSSYNSHTNFSAVISVDDQKTYQQQLVI